MSEVEVEIVGPIRRPKGAGSRLRVPLPEKGTVAAVLEALGYGEADRAMLRAMIDGQPVHHEHRLAGGESVKVFMVLGGG